MTTPKKPRAKSLGQVAYDARNASLGINPMEWGPVALGTKRAFSAAARAVIAEHRRREKAKRRG